MKEKEYTHKDQSEIVRQGKTIEQVDPDWIHLLIIYLPAIKASTMSRASESE